LKESEESHEAVFGEGYWSDHFTYNLDLIETYLLIYPDKVKELLFDDEVYKYYQSPVDVLPRSQKYGLTKKNVVRQYGSTARWNAHDLEQMKMKEWRSNWHRQRDGQIYCSTLMAKLISLATVKFATLDPLGYGISMEANKPGWNDAMNGLPGLLASSVPEAIELYRLLGFITSNLKHYEKIDVKIYAELSGLMEGITRNLLLARTNHQTQFEYWDHVTTLLETYRSDIRLTISGEEKTLSGLTLLPQLELMKEYLKKHLEELYKMYDIMPTYLRYDVSAYARLQKDGNPVKTPYGLEAVSAKEFVMRALPPFLEAPARFLKVAKDFGSYDLKKRYQSIKGSGIFDEKLRMYKTSDDLDGETIEIGRIRAFTKGWLERESDFMHMTFKYLFGLLKSGEYDAFFHDIKTNMPPFLNAKMYGRSIYENSSFIATSNNPDPAVHGQGFVSRLSGSNTEVLSMWFTMMFGHKPFYMEEGTLRLALKPILPAAFFKDEIIKTKFLGSIEIVYQNTSGLNTYDPKVSVRQYELIGHEEKKIISGPVISGADALDVRNHRYAQIRITLA
jgi:hypothetical protein